MNSQKPSKIRISFPSFKLFNLEQKKIKIPKSSINISELKLFEKNIQLNKRKLPSINFNISSSISTNQNSFQNSGKNPISLKKYNINNSFFNIFGNKQTKFRNRFKHLSIEKDTSKNRNNSLKLSKSTPSIKLLKSIKKYRMRNSDLNFHKNLMSFNMDKLNKSNQEDKKNIIEDTYIKNISKESNNKEKNMGIFGSGNNIINIIRAEMERLKYDNIYKGVSKDLKEVIIDEILDAQVKLKRKPENLVYNKKLERPLYLKKIDKYRYISSMNRIRVLNQVANFSVVEEDGKIMKRLSNDAYDALVHKRGKNQ